MRPLQIAAPQSYSATEQQAKMVGQQAANQEPPARILSVADFAQEAATILEEHWVSKDYSWDDDSQKRQFEADLVSMGNGWNQALLSLRTQVGSYCAFCESPIPSGTRIAHLLPENRFPTAAFDFENLLLACSACLYAKGDQPNQATVRQNSQTAASTLMNPQHLAWPTRYWQALPNPAILPFRYDLVVAEWNEERLERIRLVLPTEYPLLLQAWRNGELSRNRGVLTTREGAVIVAHISPSGANNGLRQGVQAMIELFQLNQVLPSGENIPFDNRLALRTDVFLQALNTRLGINTAVRHYQGDISSTDPTGSMIRSAGFWGVWLTVLADVPGAENYLSTCFPGLPATRWIL